jgi:large conductance mechanosensitive channel
MALRQGRRATTGFLRDFQEFALKGNIVELAIAVIIGAAFGKIVTSCVQDIVMPIINPIIPGGDWRNLTVGDNIKIGSFLGTIIDFAIIALVLFLALRFLARLKRADTPPAPNEKECPYCLEKVPLVATRCRACTSDLL